MLIIQIFEIKLSVMKLVLLLQYNLKLIFKPKQNLFLFKLLFKLCIQILDIKYFKT